MLFFCKAITVKLYSILNFLNLTIMKNHTTVSILKNLRNFTLVLILCASFFSEETIAQNYTSNKVKSNTTVNKQMQWVYGGYRFTINLNLKIDAYKYYKKQSKKNTYKSYAQEHYDYLYLQEIAKKLKVDADELGYKGLKLAEYLTAFVQQNIEYTKDPYNNGYDYPKFPIETLMEKKGDCEDSAILLVTLLKIFGFDALLIRLPKHMAVGISSKKYSSYYSFEGKQYAYIETTNSKREIGEMPKEYKKVAAKLIKTPYINPYGKSKKSHRKANMKSKNKKILKTITIGGVKYSIKPNETLDFIKDGMRIQISN